MNNLQFLKTVSFLLLHLFSLILPSGVPNSNADEVKNRENIIKASFLIKLSNFVKWTDESNLTTKKKQLRLCIVGKNPFGSILTLINKEGVLEEDIVIKQSVSYEEMNKCHILFIASSEQSNLEEILKKVSYFPVLVVGDTEGFIQRGVDVNFKKINNRINFEINIDAVKRKGIKISSELLKLALVTYEDKTYEIAQKFPH